MEEAALSERPIYLDHHATTPVDPRVADRVRHGLLAAFGNPNSVDHDFGEEAAGLLDTARSEVALLVGADPDGVHFTTGSTESIQLAVGHAIATRRNEALPLRVAASTVEHRAVLNALAKGARAEQLVVQWLPVDDRARLDLSAFETACRQGVDLICVMGANNEVGTINPVKHIAEASCHAGARLLIDATQSAGREPLSVEDWGVTYLALSAHKLYGPKGGWRPHNSARLISPSRWISPRHWRRHTKRPLHFRIRRGM